MRYKNMMIFIILFVSLLSIGAVSAVDNITVNGDSVVDGEVEMPTERLEIKFNDNAETLDYNIFDERLNSGQIENINYDYIISNKSYSSGQGHISSPTQTMYKNTLKYYVDGEHNLVIHKNNQGTKTLLFNVTFDVKNSTALSDDIIIQNTKTVKYSIKNGVISGSFPEEYRTLKEGWNNLTEYSILNTGMGETKPVILKVYYMPYIINNTDIRIVSVDSDNRGEENNLKNIADEVIQEYGEYNAKIIAKDVTLEYSSEDYEITIYIEDNNHNPIEMAEPYFDDYLNSWYDENGYYHFFPMYLDVGTHKVEFTLDDGRYKAEPVSINLKIVPSIFYGDIKCKSYYGTDKTTLTMKATVYDPDADCYEDGYVTFKVNGKSYKVKTKNGVATKTIKIKKAGTYTYTAKFTNNNYKSSVTGKAKLYVYSTTKKARTFNVKGYKFTLTQNQYKKLINAKNTGKTVGYNIKTNKKVKQTITYDYKKFKTIKAPVYAFISYGGKNPTKQQQYPNKYTISVETKYTAYVEKGKLMLYTKANTINELKKAKVKDMAHFSMR